MSIVLNVDTYLLCSMFNINANKLTNEYSGMSIEDIMQTEVKQGNTEAAKFDSSVLSDPVKLIELFELQDPENKFAILTNMNESDLEDLLPLLESKDLVTGLNFFTKDKLIELMSQLPSDQLINVVLQMFPPEQLMQYMPEKEIDKVLMSTKIDKQMEIKYLKALKPEILAQMYEAATGQPAPGAGDIGVDGKPHFDGKQLLAQIENLPDDKFQEAMLGIPTQNKKEFMLKLTAEDPKLFQLFSSDAYANIIGQRKEKEDIIRASNVIEQDNLVEMIEELPQDLTAVVLTQIDTSVFANVLLGKFKNILGQVVAG